MDTTKESPTVLSLCPGLLLGLDRGFEAVLGRKPRTVAYVEIEAFIVANLIAGMEAGVLDAVPVWSNLKTFPWSLLRGKVDWFLGGYPCQPFSNAGKRGGAEDPRHLWPYIAEGIRTIRPMGCFFENVSGHLTLGYEAVRGELQDMGYRVAEGIFSAEEVGAPHRRERLFILALLGDPKSLYAQGCLGRSEQGESWRTSNESDKLAYPNSYGYQKRNGLRRIKVGPTKGKAGRRKWERVRIKSTPSSEIMAHSNIKRLQGWIRTKLSECSFQWTSRTRSPLEGTWPSRQEQKQYKWEEPRTIKPGMGCTVNGYNFREDLLRGEGNGVVWQTAELAFRTLLKKHERKNL